MTLVVAPPSVGAWGIDTATPITASEAAKLRAAGCTFALRYLTSLTADELDALLSNEIGVGLLTYGSPVMNATSGAQQAQEMLDHASELGFPPGVVMGLDLESPAPGTAVADILACERAFGARVDAAHFEPGVYPGAGIGLTSAQLTGMVSRHYMKPGSRVEDLDGLVAEPACGWQVLQAYPFNQVCCGVNVDYDLAIRDWDGRGWPMLWRDAPTAMGIPIPFPQSAS